MNLSKPLFLDLKKITVKIICAGKEGTGTLILIGGTLYVLTAAHVIEDENTQSQCELSQISVHLIKNSSKYNFTAEKLLLFNQVTDAAVFRVKNDNNMPLSGLKKIKFLTHEVVGSATLCGFNKGSDFLKQYSVEKRGDNLWGLTDIQLNVQPVDCLVNYEGFSVGGVFYQDTDGVLYLSAYMEGLGSYGGNNNELRCLPIQNFREVKELESIIDERKYDYVSDSGSAKEIEKKTNLKPLDKSSYKTNHEERFISSEKLDEIIEILRDDDEPTILLTALSGMGKSRLIFEAFKNSDVLPNRYYTKYTGNKTEILNEITIILRKAMDEDGIIIIDDCPLDVISEIISIRNSENYLFRLIFVNHDFFSDELANIKDCKVIRLTPEDIKKEVDKYISDSLNEDERNKYEIAEIKGMAEGYPQMAIELVKAYKDNPIANPDAVKHLMPKLLSFTEGNEKEEKAIWQTLSLCMPFPYSDASHEGFKYMISNSHFTELGDMDFIHRRSMTAKIIDKHKPILVDVVGNWLYVRPFPLAVWLTAEWFKNVCNTSAHFKELIDGIKKQPELIQNSISEGFCKHIQQMHGNKAAFELVERLVNSDVNGPFFDEEVLCSGMGSKLFLAMSSVNPSALAKCIFDLLKYKSIEWIGLNISGDIRRNLIWALETLCFNKDSYPSAIKVLALLAISEDEVWETNDSRLFGQFFHIFLSGTEVDLQERMNTLHYLRDKGKEYQNLLLHSIDRAFDNESFVRCRTTNQFGEDYKPSPKEVLEYWEECTKLLHELLDNDISILDRVSQIAINHVLRWSHDRLLEKQFPLLSRIAILKGGIWPEMYDVLSKHNQKYSYLYSETFCSQFSSFIDKIRPNYFCQKLKDARYEVNKDYRVSIEKRMQHEKELSRELAQEFVEQGFYNSYDEIKQIVEDKDFMDIHFSFGLFEVMTDEQVGYILDIFNKLINEGSENILNSSFFFRFCYVFRRSERVRNFLDEIFKNGHTRLYIKLIAHCETDDFLSYNTLKELHSNGVLTLETIQEYLNYVPIHSMTQFSELVKKYYYNYPQLIEHLMAFIIRHQFNEELFKNKEIFTIIKDIILKYPITEVVGTSFYEYMSFTADILERYHDDEFGASFNKKIMEALKTQFINGDIERVYPILITQYTDAIWVDLEKAFSDKEYYLFLYQITKSIGSGMGFGVGAFFTIGDDKIKKLCKDYPTTAPAIIAEMCPIFRYENDNSVSGFNEWVMWLLDEFGDMDNVRSGLDSNMGSYSWVGSVIPLLEQKKHCFELLQDHKNHKVRKWVEKNLRQLEKEISAENDREDFMKLRYS